MPEWLLSNPLLMLLIGAIAVLTPAALFIKWLNRGEGSTALKHHSKLSLRHQEEGPVKPYALQGKAAPPSQLSEKAAARLLHLEEHVAQLEGALKGSGTTEHRGPKVVCPVHGEVETLRMLGGALLCPHPLYLSEGGLALKKGIKELELKIQELEARVERLQRQVNRHVMESG